MCKCANGTYGGAICMFVFCKLLNYLLSLIFNINHLNSVGDYGEGEYYTYKVNCFFWQDY